jgi:uncharacterized protein YndB with AHSA1/START domain
MPGTMTIDDLTLNLTKEIQVNAPLEITFATLLEQLGPANETPEGKSLAMKLEPWPGGRWFRDLGDENGHFWGNVQAIKRPTLLEITGPLFMSAPVASNVQYRLTESRGGTLITFRHTAFGIIPAEYKSGVNQGWTYMLDSIRTKAENASLRNSTGHRPH